MYLPALPDEEPASATGLVHVATETARDHWLVRAENQAVQCVVSGLSLPCRGRGGAATAGVAAAAQLPKGLRSLVMQTFALRGLPVYVPLTVPSVSVAVDCPGERKPCPKQ